MPTKDIFQAIGDLDETSVQRVIDRLEFRGRDAAFVAMRQAYLQQMAFADEARILDLGCGTGVVARSLAAGFAHNGSQPVHHITGVDYSPELIEAARRLADAEGLADRVTFRVGNAESLEDADASYDAVILHTLVSHVPNPATAVAEAARVVKPGGWVAIFDGDYASLTYATGDHGLDAEIAAAILTAVVANPFVMRDMPLLIQQTELEITNLIPHVHAEAGQGAFFASLAETYIPLVIQEKIVSELTARQWIGNYHRASKNGRAFAACNYYAYIARRPPS